MWVSKVIVPLPSEHDVLDRLLGTVDAMKERDAIYDIPSIEPVEAEWTGFRKDANEKTKHMTDLPESELYDKMMQDTTSDVTVLYMHGGALIMMVSLDSRRRAYGMIIDVFSRIRRAIDQCVLGWAKSLVVDVFPCDIA